MQTQQSPLLRIYKTNQLITTVQDLPITSSQRISTDIFCTIISSLFAIGMLATAIVVLDLNKLQQMTYPTDQMGRRCTLDNNNYNYLYFASPTDPMKRLCVASCPTGTEQKLNCWPTQKLSCAANNNMQFEVSIYPSQPSQTSLGLFCQAIDPVLNQKLLSNAGLSDMYSFVTSYRSIGFTFLVALGVGLIAALLFSWIPRPMTLISIVMGGIGCIGTGVYLILSISELFAVYSTLVWIFAISLFLIGLLLIWASFFKCNDINTSISFLVQAGKCFWSNPGLILLSFFFVLLLVGLIALCGFQTLAYWSHSQMNLSPNQVYYRPSGTFAIVMTILNAVQFIWGLCFLKQAFNFIISGSACNWYFNQTHAICPSFFALLRYHWGSVSGAAFLLNLLYPLDLIYDLVKPDQRSQGCYRTCCIPCERVLDLSRSQSMTLIHMTGMPYCNSARWCQTIQYHSKVVQGNQSTNRYVRIGSHMFLASLCTLLSYIYMSNNEAISSLALLINFIISLFVLTFFVCLIKDIAECLFMSELVEEYYERFGSGGKGVKGRYEEGYDVVPTRP